MPICFDGKTNTVAVSMVRSLRAVILIVTIFCILPSFSSAWIGGFQKNVLRHTKRVQQRSTSPLLVSSLSEHIVAARNQHRKIDGSFGWSDEKFQSWILEELVKEAPALYEDYPDVFAKASRCITLWRQRFRGNMLLWKRIFKKERVTKEVIEAVPIVHAVDQWISSHKNVTIIDLCSGKGYLSMLLSEYLPPDRVEKFLLIDKAWPMCHSTPGPHHMNWDHIYGNTTEINETYFTTWPIALHTSKQDLKQRGTFRHLQKRLENTPGPVLVLAVHLCGTLSIQAVQLFHQIPKVKTLVLKPCCLPGMAYQHQQKNFFINGSRYSFPTRDVCAPGKWAGKEWKGPPRWHLEDKFNTWCHHLHEGMKDHDDSNVQSKLLHVKVQNQGGFQNTFLFAEKKPATNDMWESIDR